MVLVIVVLQVVIAVMLAVAVAGVLTVVMEIFQVVLVEQQFHIQLLIL